MRAEKSKKRSNDENQAKWDAYVESLKHDDTVVIQVGNTTRIYPKDMYDTLKKEGRI